uniref:Ras GTPase-activating protein gap-2 n=1 Tax=Parascaris univalens TaxID=6257 RepID=A0A915A6L5_PARUN
MWPFLLHPMMVIWHFVLFLWSLLIRLWIFVSRKRRTRIVISHRRNDFEHQSSPFLPESEEQTDEQIAETCFEALDDGTESLDRRGWQQRAHALGGHNGSAHNLMSMSAINGSNSFYQEGPGVAIVDGPTTPQRLANFFARPFRTNPLKRTKSVSKLDRKRTPNDPDYTSSRPELQRSQENVCTLGSSSLYGNRWPIGGCNGQSCAEHNPLRSCRSHESLLSYSTTSHMIDMGAADVRIHAVHPSVLDVPNCFKVANTYYACRTPMERNRWIENLRRTMNPRRDEMRRTENALEIWILEAKGVPVKRRYYCEICLDKTLVGRTSAKPRADICFWGEHFDYSPIPKVDDLCINLYRDADPKKKKDRSTLIGYVQIKIDQLTARHPVERWYTVTASSDGSKLPGLGKDKGEAAAIRIKARYQSVDILPMYMYDELLRFVRLRYLSLCLALEPLLGVRAKEDFATALVRIMHKQRMAKEFLCDLIMCEVDVLDNEHLMFRGNSLATKAMEAYMKLVADEYLKETLGEFVKSILESDDICEVDPLKMVANNQATLERNRQHLTFNVEAAWGKIVNSTSSFPLELRDIFDSLRRRLEQADRRDLADTLISSSIFLRFLCPAILSPSLFNLVSEYPSGSAARNLTLIAKTLQTLANFTKFGGKEHYMEFMNEFVTREWDNMHHYLMRISTAPPRSEKQSASGEWDACVDLGKEISLLHSYLDEIWTEEVHEQAIAHDRSLEEIRKILSRLDMRRQSGDSSIDLRDYDSRNAQSPASDYDNAGILRSRNHNVPAYPYVHGTGQAQVMSRSTPASHLGTNDDYVLDIALLNDSLAIRHAGICVQQHRNGQHKNHRHPVDASPREQTTQRNAISPHHPVDDDGRPRLTAYHSNENASAATTSSSVSRTSTKSYSTATTDRHNDEDTDSDDAVGPQTRHARPPRKGKRRANGQQSRNETPTRTNVVASQPPSSGYQSQNHSSSLSSSNSSSPVERSTMVPGSEPQSALKIANKMFTSHTPMPSTSYPPTYDQMVMGPRAAAENTSPVPSTDLTTYYRTTGFSTTSENAGVHEVGKCSLPRTNPRYSGRSSFGASMNAGVVKPTLIDVGIESDTDVVTATPVRAAGVLIENNNDAKQYDGVWAIPEQRSNISERWTNAYPCDASLQQSQQEIIEQQKREIMRLMRENEELKKHVAAQQNTSQKPSSIASKTIDSQPFADSGASEDSYDSLSSFSDHTAALPQKAATHC